MKTWTAALFVVAMLPAVCSAQPAGATAPAPGASSPGFGPGRGPGGGPGAGPMHRGRWGSDYTPGWGMMTPKERDEHRERMSQARTQEECRQAFEEHRALMQKRAAERGMTMRGPRRDACAGLPK